MAASPLRTAANSLKISFECIPELNIYNTPSCTTIKRWVQQVGYFKLNCPKTISDDWMVIIDASIQMGEKKCVLVLGCRKAYLPWNRALTLEDLEILSMQIVSNLNGDVIMKILCETEKLVGKIIAVCSDRGSEILRGIKNFQIISPETRHIGDTAHRVANLLEADLEKSKRWKEFREQVTPSRRKMQNSLVPGALPPSPRTKARYMNVGSLINWASDMLILLDFGVSTPELNVGELRKYLGWLSSYRDEINYWNTLILIGVTARNIVRIEGIHVNIVDAFEQAISPIKMGFRELRFADQITLFLLDLLKGIQPGDRLIGSTEVLESLFGKIKYMEHEQTAFGFTSLLLAAIACVGPTKNETIIESMKSVKLSDINGWAVKEIGQSVQSQRRIIKKIVKKLSHNMGQEFSGILEGSAMGF